MKLPPIPNPLFALTFAVASFAAFAEPADMGMQKDTAPEWTEADSNRDGFLTKDELVSFPTLGQDFEKIDTDGDHKISQDEYTTWHQVTSKHQ